MPHRVYPELLKLAHSLGDPLKDEASSGQFSSVRHAGCAYALAWLGAS